MRTLLELLAAEPWIRLPYPRKDFAKDEKELRAGFYKKVAEHLDEIVAVRGPCTFGKLAPAPIEKVNLRTHAPRGLTPSAINRFATEPTAYILDCLFYLPRSSALKPIAGRIAEFVTETLLQDDLAQSAITDFDKLVATATEKFFNEIRSNNSYDAYTDEEYRASAADAILGGINIATAMVELGPLDRSQSKVETSLRYRSGTRATEPMTIYGRLDFMFPSALVDEKYTEKVPPKPDDGHARQISLYARHVRRQPMLAYGSASRHRLLELSSDEVQYHLFRTRALTHAMQRIIDRLSESGCYNAETPMQRLDCAESVLETHVPLDLDSYTYDPTSLTIIESHYGITTKPLRIADSAKASCQGPAAPGPEMPSDRSTAIAA